MSDNPNLTNEVLQLAATLVFDLCNLGLHKKFVTRSPDTHETLYALTNRLEALGYMERFRDGTAPVEH